MDIPLEYLVQDLNSFEDPLFVKFCNVIFLVKLKDFFWKTV